MKRDCNSEDKQPPTEYFSFVWKRGIGWIKKHIVLFAWWVIGVVVLIVALRGIDMTPVDDASVSSVNGDVAIVTNTNETHIFIFDRNGLLKYTVSLSDQQTGGGLVYLDYVDQDLFVFSVRTKDCFIIDTEGNLIQTNSVPDGVCNDSWNENWENLWYMHRIQEDDRIILYEQKNIFERSFCNEKQRFLIHYQNGSEVILWESP